MVEVECALLVRMSEKLHTAIVIQSIAERRPMAEVVREAVRQYLARQESS